MRGLAAGLSYPAVRRAATQYTKHGVRIPDPYQWLEDPNSDDTKAFVTEQNKLFRSVVDNSPHRPVIHGAIERMMNYPRTSAPSLRNGRYYYNHNTGLQNQAVIMRTAKLEDEAEVFLDPNALSDDGTTAISVAAWSKSNKYYAYALSDKGSDWCTIHVMDEHGTKLDDECPWVKFSSIAWYKDVGFFYMRFPEGVDAEATDVLENASVFFHRLGTAAAADVHVLSIPEHPKLLMTPEVGDYDEFVVFTIRDGCEPNNLVWVAPLPENLASTSDDLRDLPLVKVVNSWTGSYDFLGNNGAALYFKTTKDAPMGKVVALDATTPDADPSEIVAPRENAKLDSCAIVGNTLLLVYLEDVKNVLYRRPLPGGPDVPHTRFDLPIATIQSLNCRRHCNFVSLKLTSFLLPGRVLCFDIDAPEVLHRFRDDVVQGFDPDAFELKQVFFPSPSGGRHVPMFICHRKGFVPKGDSPALLYGYGGFNISITPSFSASRVVFMNELNGVFAVANIRGGGEYGEQWHQAGARAAKENCFTDFEHAASYLHTEGYSCPEKTAIFGGSNGGLLVAACANRSPHLFGAVVCAVGVLDMYKFHQFTIGHAWKSDFGDPEVAADFQVLQRYSPVHNVRCNRAYPAVLVTTGDHDDRVVPLHSHKYVATMQHADPEGSVFARVEVAAGHGAGMPMSKIVEESADVYTFLAMALGISPVE